MDLDSSTEYYRTADRTPLPESWRSELPIRWVLDETKPTHCDVCMEYAREYPSLDRMLKLLDGAQPGYFPGRSAWSFLPDQMTGRAACGPKCTCHLEVKMMDEWKRLVRL